MAQNITVLCGFGKPFLGVNIITLKSVLLYILHLMFLELYFSCLITLKVVSTVVVLTSFNPNFFVVGV